ncbi:SDR family NAD(P)-dependent oxidoreductase [Neorhizobium sp. NCHU2750]|uniref:SDR family NAD(P)-dependent oxidoreductase n=1 Tax=Neorhizobium sp. NCHU2750 TaxID=1825976 RepID=UPI000EB75ABB|nr:3-oxoacyl-ACP reductase [Neorhizobium sp. NCHU2750]
MAYPSAAYPDLKGRGILVTGGGSGIGASLVEGFARQGARVAFIDIAEAPSLALVESLTGKTDHAPLFVRADLSDVSATQAAVLKVAEALGTLSVVVNNAGWDDRREIEDITEDYWDKSQAINLKQMFFTAQAAIPFIRAAGGGSIVNFSSISYLLNMGSLPSYTTAKAGIVGLTKSLAGKLGPGNIRVNAVLPGMIVTERQKRLWLTDDGIAAMIDRQCLKRSLDSTDLVGPCLFLASDSSSAITAQTLIVDGGAL